MSHVDVPPAAGVFLPWDTDFFGFRIGRVTPHRLTPAVVHTVLSWSAAERLRCLYLFADSTCADTLALAHEAGFKFVDLRVDLALSLESLEAAAAPAEFRPANSADLPAMEGLSRVSHTDTRFFKDLNFPRDRCAELYAEWIRRDFRDHRIFTLSPAGGPPMYVTCQIDPVRHAGRIGLIAVAPEIQGRGHGHQLVSGALAWFKSSGCSEVRVATQGSNVAAQRLYESAGFKVAEARATYHRWF